MNRRHLLLVAAASFGAALPSRAEDIMDNKIQPASHPYVGMWVTADGHIRRKITAMMKHAALAKARIRAGISSPAITSIIGTIPGSPPMATSSTACCIMRGWCSTGNSRGFASDQFGPDQAAQGIADEEAFPGKVGLFHKARLGAALADQIAAQDPRKQTG